MKRVCVILLAVFLSSCRGVPAPTPTVTPSKTPLITETPLPIVTPVCISSELTKQDIADALLYTGDIFDSSEWEQSQVSDEERVSVTWQNIPQSAVAFLEVIIFPCGYEEPDLNRYFNDEHWDTLFENYDSYEMLDECSIDSGLRLYQFEASSQGFDYNINYWSESNDAEHIITTMITFPFGSEIKLDEYSIQLFPELSNCS